ncbi:MAG: DUF4190 domain-containing protein [Rhodoglobus sp.]
METLTNSPETSTAPTSVVQSNTLAIVSFVLGLSSILTGFQVVLGAAAVVLGIMSLRRESAGGKFAIWGIITGSLSVAGLLGTGLLALLFIPFAATGILFW